MSDNSSETNGQQQAAPQGQPQGQAQVPHRYAPAAPGLEVIFADGIGRAMIERGLLKLDLFSVVGFDQEKNEEVRTIAKRLVLPMTAVQELAQVLQHIGNVAKRQQEAQQQQQQT